MPHRTSWGVSSLVVPLILVSLILGIPASSPATRHEAWVEVRSPNFVVVSNAGEKQARKTAVQFEQIRAVFRQSLTVASSHPSHTITIFAAKDEDTMKSLLPEYWAKGHVHPGGIFFARMNEYYAAANLDAQGTNPYETIYHEYYHSLTLPYFPNLPLWLSEGLADFYGNTQVASDHASLGMPDQELIAQLQTGSSLIPFSVLFKVDHTSPYYNEANKTSLFYAESWALTHYLMIGDREAHRPMLAKYLDALSHDKSQDEAAAEAFGDLKKLQAALENYIRGYAFFYQKAAAPPKISDSDMKARALSDGEFDALKGGFASARGRYDDARALLAEAIQLDPKLALAQENLALVDFYERKNDEALAAVTRAIELDPKNATTRYLRGYLAFFGSGRASGMLDPQVESDLRQAIAADPNFTPPFALLALCLIPDEDHLPEALTLAKKAVAAEPGNSNYMLSLAQVLARMDRFGDAQNVAVHARAAAAGPEDRANVEDFLAFLAARRETVRRYETPPAADTVASEKTASGSSSRVDEPTANAYAPAPAVPDDKEYEQAAQGTKRAIASGNVLHVTCAGDDLRLALLAHGVEFNLRARIYERVEFTSTGTPPKGIFMPCRDLSGLEAKITFLPAQDQTRGVIQAIELHDVGAIAPRDDAPKQPATSTAALPQRGATASDATRETTGTVTQNACHGRQLDIDVESSAGPTHFHGARGEFRLTLPPRLAQSGFDLCSQLKGRQVLVRYAADAQGAKDIAIIALRVVPANSAGNGNNAASAAGPSLRHSHVNADPTTTPTADGKVTEVTCNGNELTVKLQAGERLLTLHARDYTRLNFDQEVGFETKDFQPCTQLKDHTASITYTAVSNKPYNGEIQSIEVEQ